MCDYGNHGKVKNEKLLRWRVQLSAFDFKISYRPGKLNVPPDILSRAFRAVTQVTSLQKIHESLCHPGITRLFHLVRTKNLPFSVEDVRKTVGNFRVYSEIQPQFYAPPAASLIKATKPFERISLDQWFPTFSMHSPPLLILELLIPSLVHNFFSFLPITRVCKTI